MNNTPSKHATDGTEATHREPGADPMTQHVGRVKTNMSRIFGFIGRCVAWYYGIVFLMAGVLLVVSFPRKRDAEGVEAARALTMRFKPANLITLPIEFPADVASRMTEVRTREIHGFTGGEKFYSFKLHSNDVERLVQHFRIERVKDMHPPQSRWLPPWWEEITTQWPTNAICYYKAQEPYKIYYLPDTQQCLFHWFMHD